MFSISDQRCTRMVSATNLLCRKCVNAGLVITEISFDKHIFLYCTSAPGHIMRSNHNYRLWNSTYNNRLWKLERNSKSSNVLNWITKGPSQYKQLHVTFPRIIISSRAKGLRNKKVNYSGRGSRSHVTHWKLEYLLNRGGAGGGVGVVLPLSARHFSQRFTLFLMLAEWAFIFGNSTQLIFTVYFVKE